MRKILAFSVAVAFVGLLGGCPKSESLDCSDYVIKGCNKANECGILAENGISLDMCKAFYNDQVSVGRATTDECKVWWEDINAQSCASLILE